VRQASPPATAWVRRPPDRLSASFFTVIRRAAFPIIATRETIGGFTAPTQPRMTDMPVVCHTSTTRRYRGGGDGEMK
jgi:hypothetical protein